MPRQNAVLHGFNRGIVGATSLARIDLERMRLSAETQTNWMPRSLGSMMLRPGTRYLLSTLSNAKAKTIPFIYSTTDIAYLECTASYLRPIVSDAVITRPSVSTAVTSGDFSAGTGWTLTATGGGTVTITGGKLTIASTVVDSYGTAEQTLTIAGGDQNVEHALRIVVDAGPINFRLGSSSGGDEYITATTLGVGTHSLAFTPTGASAYIRFEGRERRDLTVDSCTIEAAGDVTLPGFWTEDDLSLLRWSQSGDVVFIACYGYQPRRIERRATRSWSIILYDNQDGPFAAVSTDDTVKMTLAAAYGTTTLTASRPIFKSTHVGALFRVFTPGYNLPFSIGQNNVATPVVRVNGVGTAARLVKFVITGTWVGTIQLQASYTDENSGFANIATQYTTINATFSYYDTADNSPVWYRVVFTSYTSGTATCTPDFGAAPGSLGTLTSASTATGGRYGIVRVTSLTSSTVVNVEVLSPPSSNIASNIWYEGEWSDRKGWPSAVDFHEGRLFMGGGDQIWGSVSDAYSSFDLTQVGDSGPIQRSIGRGPVQIINWMLPLTRLVVGTEAGEVGVRSSSFDEPLTPTNFSLKEISTYGSSRAQAVKIDTRGVFIDKSGQRLMEIAYLAEVQDYVTRDLLLLAPDINLNNPMIALVVQRQPDTRIHAIREDGTVLIYLYEPSEDLRCPVIYETDGVVEDAFVLPGTVEDSVIYVVKRTIGGVTKRYYEKWAREDECRGSTLNKQADSFILYSGASTTTITGLSHLEGEEVVVWGDGVDLSPLDDDGVQTTYTVASGQITGLSSAVTSAVVGLPYTAQFKSTKLAYAASMGTSLGQVKKVGHVGLVLYKTHYQGIRHGYDFDHLDALPLVKDGATIAANTIHDHFDEPMNPQRGSWDPDARLCLEAKAPRPCTVLGAVIGISAHDKGT